MNYSNVKRHDIANGPGVRVSLFVSGCEHACPGCFNPEAWQFAFGEPFTPQVAQKILEALRPAHIRGLTLLGGEPLHPHNRADVLSFVNFIRTELPEKDIWCYTGYLFDNELLPACAQDAILWQLLSQIDVLVDGRFVQTRKDLNLRFRGSANQRLLRCKESLKAGTPVIWEDK
jgi:anaerobic ribonucleoside-triphosphate reductase activating protein